jgi:hypothetical protein
METPKLEPAAVFAVQSPAAVSQLAPSENSEQTSPYPHVVMVRHYLQANLKQKEIWQFDMSDGTIMTANDSCQARHIMETYKQ